MTKDLGYTPKKPKASFSRTQDPKRTARTLKGQGRNYSEELQGGTVGRNASDNASKNSHALKKLHARFGASLANANLERETAFKANLSQTLQQTSNQTQAHNASLRRPASSHQL